MIPIFLLFYVKFSPFNYTLLLCKRNVITKFFVLYTYSYNMDMKHMNFCNNIFSFIYMDHVVDDLKVDSANVNVLIILKFAFIKCENSDY